MKKKDKENEKNEEEEKNNEKEFIISFKHVIIFFK